MIGSLWFNSFSAGGGGGGTGDYELISTSIVSGTSTNSVTFSSIPSTYRHLQLRLTSKIGSANTSDDGMIRLNGDTASNYSWHMLNGYGAGINSQAAPNQSFMLYGAFKGTDTTYNWGASIVDILDYGQTTKYTTIRALGGSDDSAIRLISGNWRNTAAVTSITVAASSNATIMYKAGSRLSLYGLK